MRIIFRYFLISYVIILIESCTTDRNNPLEININYTSVDSIKIESTDVVRFLSYDSKTNQFLFIEKSKNELLLYDHGNQSVKNLSPLKDEFPVINDLIVTAHLSNDTITVIGGSSVYQYSLASNEIIFSRKGLIARVPDASVRLVPYKDGSLLSNLTFYNSIERNDFEAFSYVIYDSIGNYINVFGNPSVPNTPDIRFLTEFDVDTDEIFHYKFPFDKLYKGSISELKEGASLSQTIIDVSFLKDHPYYNEIPYNIGDFPFIPLVFNMHLDEDYLFFFLADGGDKKRDKHMDTYSLIIYDREGNFLGKSVLRKDLSNIVGKMGENKYLFVKNPNLEYRDKTVFDIVEMRGLPGR